MGRGRKLAGGLVAAGLAAAGVGAAVWLDDRGSSTASDSTRIPQASPAQLAAARLDRFELAPESDRVDLAAPTFSHPTRVTNPLFPISRLRSAVLNGRVEGKAFHTETTLLPDTRVIEWAPGRPVKTLVSQYAAFLDGRINEVALDYYAQADDGSVWYFGEDVFNYNEAGLVTDNSDSWLAGKEGPPAMIMPGHPKVGDVYRTENIPGLVFEEVTVKATGRTMAGPSGPVEGAIVGRELHSDGSYSDKVFAPGYGEFFTREGKEIEAMAVASTTDALGDPVPAELETLARGAPPPELARAWRRYRRSGEVPPRLAAPMRDALRAAGSRDPRRARAGAIDVTHAALDLELRYRPRQEIDVARFRLWARRLELDAAARDLGAVRGDLAALEWIRDRIARGLDPVTVTRIDARLLALRSDVDDRSLRSARADSARLQATG
jgi:hypothetical protein